MKWPWQKKQSQPNLRDFKERKKLVRAMPSRGNLDQRARGFSQDRRKKLWRKRIEWLQIFWKKNFRILMIPILVIFVALGSVGFRKMLEATDYLSIKQLRIIGVEDADKQEISDFLQGYEDMSMIGLNGGYIAADIKQEFSYVREAYVNKFLPDTLEVEIVERYPRYAYINLAGAYLVDEYGEIIQVIAQEEEEPAGYNQEEIAIINGYIDLNSDRIKQRFYQDWETTERVELAEERELSPDEIDPPEWKTVKRDRKLKIADQLRQEYMVGLQTRLEKYQLAVQELELEAVPLLTDVSTYLYKEYDSLSNDQLMFLDQAELFKDEYSMNIRSIEWLSSYNIKLTIGSGTEFLFTSNKPFVSQFQTIAAIDKVERLRKLQQVDLRGELVAVK